MSGYKALFVISQVQKEASVKTAPLQKCTLQPVMCYINKPDRNAHSLEQETTATQTQREISAGL